ncbi:MAG: TetR family transcriptional regulator C-terminal domain-containing protein [Nocardioides sp.]|uniref:TetR family transcriptional regulator C-terminal domain-containing protein n=1 Tax=Nocardioides sp. TaxID=35761 RepID=UPI0039E2CE37
MTTKRQARRAEIARAAVRPLSAEGVNNVRLADVGKSLGMTGAHILYYFESKNDLFMAALTTVEEDLRARVQGRFEGMESARERWDWLLETGAPTGLDDSGLLLWLEGWAGAVHQKEVLELITELEAAWQQLLRDVLSYAVSRGELPAEVDIDLLVEGVSALLDGLTIRVVVGYRPVDHDRAMEVVRMFLDPIVPWQDPPRDRRAGEQSEEQ